MIRKFFEKLESITVVTLITVLVWLYAEGAIQQTYPRERIIVQFISPAGEQLAIEPETTRPLVTFRGSGPQYQAFKNRVNAGPIEITVQPGEQTDQRINLDERLAQALFNNLGIALDEIDPSFEELSVRRLVRKTVPIHVLANGLALKGSPAIDPPNVEVLLPEDLVSALEQRGAQVRLDRAVANNPPPPNVPQSLTLTIDLPPEVTGRWTTPQTREANVSFTIAKVQDTLTLPSVRLAFVTPPGFAYDVVPENNEKIIRDVKLSGPSDELAKIKADPRSVVAEISFMNAADLTPGARIVDVLFRTPPGAPSVQTGLRQMSVELVPRQAPSPSPANPTP